jgi:hypothetical protein
MNNTTEIINLNVGGTKFTTTKQTLCSCKSIFSDLIKNNPTNNEIFIDRSGKYFEHILEFFRNGNKTILTNDRNILKLVYQECEYYNLIELQQKIRQKYPEETQTISNSNCKNLKKIIEPLINNGWVSNDKSFTEIDAEYEKFKQNTVLFNKLTQLRLESSKLRFHYLTVDEKKLYDSNIANKTNLWLCKSSIWLLTEDNRYRMKITIQNKEFIFNTNGIFEIIQKSNEIWEQKMIITVNLKRNFLDN